MSRTDGACPAQVSFMPWRQCRGVNARKIATEVIQQAHMRLLNLLRQLLVKPPHALPGHMPLEVTIRDAHGTTIDVLRRDD